MRMNAMASWVQGREARRLQMATQSAYEPLSSCLAVLLTT
jgi:hypothetical protein